MEKGNTRHERTEAIDKHALDLILYHTHTHTRTHKSIVSFTMITHLLHAVRAKTDFLHLLLDDDVTGVHGGRRVFGRKEGQ